MTIHGRVTTVRILTGRRCSRRSSDRLDPPPYRRACTQTQVTARHGRPLTDISQLLDMIDCLSNQLDAALCEGCDLRFVLVEHRLALDCSRLLLSCRWNRRGGRLAGTPSTHTGTDLLVAWPAQKAAGNGGVLIGVASDGKLEHNSRLGKIEEDDRISGESRQYEVVVGWVVEGSAGGAPPSSALPRGKALGTDTSPSCCTLHTLRNCLASCLRILPLGQLWARNRHRPCHRPRCRDPSFVSSLHSEQQQRRRRPRLLPSSL